MTIKEACKIIENYDNLIKEGRDAGYGWARKEIEDNVKTMGMLGIPWGEKFKIPRDFVVVIGQPYLANSETHFKFSKDENYVVWDNGNIGRLQFGDFRGEIYREFDGEWEEFQEKLLSYGALDYDPMNDRIIYDIENGKKLMLDYDEICREISSKIKVKEKKLEIEELEKRIRELQGEL